MFFPPATIILFQVPKKTRKKKLARRFVSKSKNINKMANLQDRVKLNLFVGFVECNKFFTDYKVQYKFFSFIINVLLAISKKF